MAPQVKVHLSVLVAVIAVVKAVGYYYQRFTLDLSTNGYVQGAGYTDVHARLPALSLLFWISLLAGVILLINIRNQGWLLPLIAVGLWAFVAVVVGAIYPAIVQALKVSPAQSKLELPYIQRNITATQAAYNLTPSNVTTESYAAGQNLTTDDEEKYASTFNDIRLWDPDPVANRQHLPKDATGAFVLPIHDPGTRQVPDKRGRDAGDRRRPTGEQLQLSGARVGQHAPGLYAWVRDDRFAGQHGYEYWWPTRLRRRERSTGIDQRCANYQPAAGLLRVQRPRICDRRYQAARGRLPAAERRPL